jgi:hypothetical protein
MRLSPLDLEFRIPSSRVLVDLLASPPKSAQLTALLKKTLPDLKQICRNEGLSVTGSKEDLASRIITHQSSKRDAVLEEDGEKNREVVVVEPLVERVAAQADPPGRDLDLLKKKELQGLLRQRHLPVTGSTEELRERLRNADAASSPTGNVVPATDGLLMRQDIEEEMSGLDLLAELVDDVPHQDSLQRPRQRPKRPPQKKHQRRKKGEDDDYEEMEQDDADICAFGSVAQTRARRNNQKN